MSRADPWWSDGKHLIDIFSLPPLVKRLSQDHLNIINPKFPLLKCVQGRMGPCYRWAFSRRVPVKVSCHRPRQVVKGHDKPQVPYRCLRCSRDAAGSLVPCVGDSRGENTQSWGQGGAVSAKISPHLRTASTKAKELCPRKASRKTFYPSPVYPVNELPGWSVLQNKEWPNKSLNIERIYWGKFILKQFLVFWELFLKHLGLWWSFKRGGWGAPFS